jgi:hypothetical protein
VKKYLASLGVPAAVVAGVAVLWLRLSPAPGAQGLGARMAASGDLMNYYFGTLERVALRLGAGELPLWNPNACSGVPLLATGQAAAFYPGTWLAVLLPVERALPLLLFVECALAGWFCALWLQSSGHSRPAAAMGGVLFVFAGVLGETFWPPVVATILWLPWLLLCVEKLAREWRFTWGVGLALGTALQILAGFPQYLVYSFFVVGPLAALRLVEAHRQSSQERPKNQRSRSVWVRGAGMAWMVALGVGLSGIQLLPLLELVGESARNEALSAQSVHYLNLWDPHRSIDVLRNAFDPRPKLIAFDFGSGAGYLGIATLVLIALGVATGWRTPRTWLLLTLAGISLLLSDGFFGWRGLYEVWASLPFVGSFRTPERMRVVTFFCLIPLASAGLDALFDRRRNGDEPERNGNGVDPRVRIAVVTGCACLAVGAGMLWVGSLPGSWRLLGTALFAAGLLGSQRRPWLGAVSLSGLGVLLLVDLALATGAWGSLRSIPVRLARQYHVGVHPAPDPLRLERERRALAPARVELIGFRPHVAATPAPDLERVSCYGPLVPAGWTELSERMSGKASRGATLVHADPGRFPVFYDLAGVRLIAQGSPSGDVEWIHNPDALPRAYLIERHHVASRDESLARIAANDVDPREGVALERDPGWPPGPPGVRAARIVASAPERVVIETASDRDAWLVSTDTWYPGWEASIDAIPSEILRAHGLYRAVRVPSGQHQIVFVYRPSSFRDGALLSLASAAFIGATGAAGGWLRRRRTAT